MESPRTVTLLAIPSMLPLAQEVSALSGGELSLGKLWFEHFNDGTPNVRVNTSEVYNKDVLLLADYDLAQRGADWMSTLGVIYSLPRYGARSLMVILPFFPFGTMERVSTEGEIATAMTFARLLSATPLTMNGPSHFLFFDIHALQNRFYFSDQVLPHLVSAIPLLMRKLKHLVSQGENVALAFPDDGAKKRFMPELQRGCNEVAFPVVVCSKMREAGNKRVLKITEGKEDVQGKHLVIIDDLIQSGGTMINCKDLLLKEGAKEVSGYVTHGVFPIESWKRFLSDGNPSPWRHFWVTNSIPSTAKALEGAGAPFEVLSLAAPIVENYRLFKN